jgi:hypothetical protein
MHVSEVSMRRRSVRAAARHDVPKRAQWVREARVEVGGREGVAERAKAPASRVGNAETFVARG